ncbi:MAG TPA: flagellar biosynthesis anti-sigma factor FlgM [Burkholderiaceae bacterium]|jgi:negative regulator of flagellin synthesis FlgM|nr:flagellar biosynthesis anti-sigma factor FlgM [Burkholderiaceae bacterium]
MKITSTSEPLRPDRVSAPNDARTSTARGTEAVAETERVQLSDLGSRLSQLEGQFSGSDFDVKKVEEIRNAIAEGRFKVNADAIADKLLASVSELLGKKT